MFRLPTPHRYAALICSASLLLSSPSAHAADDAPKTHCRYTNFATLPIKAVGGSVLVDGAINGTDAVMLADTGSVSTSLTRAKVDKLGLKLGHAGISTFGVGGESQVYQTMVDDLSIGKAHWHRVRMSVLWDGDMLRSFDALIGANILFYSDLELSLAKGEMKFFEPKGCDDTFLGYWDEQAVVIPMREMAPDDQRQIFEVQVNGKTLRAIIDSGASTSIINLAAAARAGVTPKSPGVVEAGSSSGIGKHELKTWRAKFDSFSIGDETIKSPTIAIHDLYGAALADANTIATSDLLQDEPDMLLGADFLRAHRVLFAVSQRRLYLSYLGGRVFGSGDAPAAGADGKAK